MKTTTTEQVIEGLTILNSYKDCHTNFNHDVIYAGPNNPEEVIEADLKRLRELGWHLDTILGCWVVRTISVAEPKLMKKDMSDWRFCLEPGDLVSLPLNCGSGNLTPVTCMVMSFKRQELKVWAFRPIYTAIRENEFEQHFSFKPGCGFWDMLKLVLKKS